MYGHFCRVDDWKKNPPRRRATAATSLSRFNKRRWYHQRKEEDEEEERRNRQSEKNTISLNFEVVDVDRAVKQLLELGGTLDGPIQFTSDKSKTVEKIAAMTTIDGHSIGLFEPKERKNE